MSVRVSGPQSNFRAVTGAKSLPDPSHSLVVCYENFRPPPKTRRTRGGSHNRGHGIAKCRVARTQLSSFSSSFESQPLWSSCEPQCEVGTSSQHQVGATTVGHSPRGSGRQDTARLMLLDYWLRPASLSSFAGRARAVLLRRVFPPLRILLP